MPASPRADQFYLIRPPYRILVPVAGPASLLPAHGLDGSALVWCMSDSPDAGSIHQLRRRPGGVPLVAILPPADRVRRPQDLFGFVDQCRPHSLLPYHEQPNPLDLRTLLAEPPGDLPGAVVEYLAWRGLVLDLGLRRTVRRILELSSELRTVSGVARSLFMSRRALGRRFMKEGLPVPSHWLQFGRVLRAVLALQRPEATLMGVAFDLGYSDGFSLSNQMKRLLGIRPRHVAARLGWEWVVECWIQEEIREGGFGPASLRALSRTDAPPGSAGPKQGSQEEGQRRRA